MEKYIHEKDKIIRNKIIINPNSTTQKLIEKICKEKNALYCGFEDYKLMFIIDPDNNRKINHFVQLTENDFIISNQIDTFKSSNDFVEDFENKFKSEY